MMLGTTNIKFILRIKEQETCVTLHEHHDGDDDDDDDDDDDYVDDVDDEYIEQGGD